MYISKAIFLFIASVAETATQSQVTVESETRTCEDMHDFIKNTLT